MTNARGTRNTNAALSEAQVIHIRELAKEVNRFGRPLHSASSIQRIYREMGIVVSTETIRRAIRGDTWSWLNDSTRSEPTEEEKARTEASLGRLLDMTKGDSE